MPIYSPDDDNYTERVPQNERPEDADFHPLEALYRRYREKDLVNGKPTPLVGFQFYETDGHSVNRGKYCEARDTLEPDCCDGNRRTDCVVLKFQVRNIPPEIVATDGSNHLYRFRLKHVPKPTCYAHSEIWCNQQGDVNQPYVRPQKHVRNLFLADLLRSEPEPLRFEPLSAAQLDPAKPDPNQ